MRCDGHSHWKTAGEDNKKVHSKGKGRVKGSLGHSAVQGAGQSGTWSSPQAGGKGREWVTAEHGAEATTGKKCSIVLVNKREHRRNFYSLHFEPSLSDINLDLFDGSALTGFTSAPDKGWTKSSGA